MNALAGTEPEPTQGRYVDAIRSLTKMAGDVARLTRERDEARAERDHLKVQLAAHIEGWAESQDHLQAVREFAWGLGASTASRAQILDACTRTPFAPEHGTPGSEPTC